MTEMGAQETIITGIIVGIVTTIILSVGQLLKSLFWNPYLDFKQELTSIDRDFVLYSNVFTSTHDKRDRSMEFNKGIYYAQNEIRTRGIDLKRKYNLIPAKERYILCVFKMLPSASEVEDISGELISIGNSAITYYDEPTRINAGWEFAGVKKSTKKIEKFIEKYSKLY